MDDLQIIQSKIYVIRGQRVMLDFNLAKLYEVETKALNQAVKRNSKRFEGEEFMFQLSKDEWISFTKSDRSMISNDTKDDSFLDNYNLRSQIISLVLRSGACSDARLALFMSLFQQSGSGGSKGSAAIG